MTSGSVATTTRRGGLSPRWLGTIGLLLLTTATGVVDAVSYLALDRVFTGNMTGNVLFLGFGLVGVADVPFLNNAVALSGFLVGALVGARLVPRGRPPVLPVATIWSLVGVTVLAGTLAVVWLVVGPLGLQAQLATTWLLAVLMGTQVCVVRPLGNTDITTVVVTSTLINLARDSRLAGAPRAETPVWMDRVLAVVSMAGGAALGALTVEMTSGATALGVATVLLGLAAGLLLATRRAQAARPGAGEASAAQR